MQSARLKLTRALIDQGYWIQTGVPGIFGRTQRFEDIVGGFDRLIADLAREQGAQPIHFPPVLDREIIRRTAYMESFPELCGSIHSFTTDRGRHQDIVDRVDEGGDWSEYLEQTDLTLCPAACYPLYPSCRGTLPEGGKLFDLSSFVFRSEPSDDPARLQSFRMRENVRLGTPDDVHAWRDAWRERGLEIIRDLDLPATLEVASDPFFGRGGKLLAANQIADEAKFEIVVPITSSEEPTAIASFNRHGDKFARIFAIELPDGEPAHTACFGFGLERVTLALLATHGLDTASWPAGVREKLSL